MTHLGGDPMPDDLQPVGMTELSASEGGVVVWTQAAVALSNAMMAGATTSQAFLQTRFLTNYDACKALICCQDVAELAGLQAGYLTATTDQYRGYARDMVGHMGDLVGRGGPRGPSPENS